MVGLHPVLGLIHVFCAPGWVIIYSGEDGTVAAISFIALSASEGCSVAEKDFIRKVEQNK